MHQALINPSGFARVSELRSLGVPYAPSTIWLKTRLKQFPAPVRIGPNCTAWKIADVLAWLEEQAAAAPAADDSQGARLTAARLAKRKAQAAAPTATSERPGKVSA